MPKTYNVLQLQFKKNSTQKRLGASGDLVIVVHTLCQQVFLACGTTKSPIASNNLLRKILLKIFFFFFLFGFAQHHRPKTQTQIMFVWFLRHMLAVRSFIDRRFKKIGFKDYKYKYGIIHSVIN